MKYLDLVGRRFQKLTVLADAGRDANGRVKWLAVCDCGNFGTYRSGNLVSGNSKSCGCEKRKPRRRADLSGRKFGRLRVRKYHSTKAGRAMWECDCSCGSRHVASSINLTKGITRSCGCLPRYDEEGLGSATWSKLIKLGQGECVKCGSGENLRAHHIYGASSAPSLSRDLSNGICLCHDCHVEFHSKYGVGLNGPYSICDYINQPELEDFMDLFVGWKSKGGVRDLRAAIRVLELMIEREEREASDNG